MKLQYNERVKSNCTLFGIRDPAFNKEFHSLEDVFHERLHAPRKSIYDLECLQSRKLMVTKSHVRVGY